MCHPLSMRAEALAAREYVVWAVTRDFKNLVIEGDSIQILRALADASLTVHQSGI